MSRKDELGAELSRQVEEAGAELSKQAHATQTDKPRPGGEMTDTQFVYCGPSIPGRLGENAVLRGTREEIRRYYADVLGRLPQVDGLIVPVCKLADTRKRLRTAGNAVHKRYHDIASLLHSGGTALGGEQE